MKALFVVGPSGSGKTTLSKHLLNIYQNVFGKNSVSLINLDAANDNLQKSCIDIKQLITIEDIMQQYQLGPNGSLIYSIDFLYENIDWLMEKLLVISNKTQNNIKPANKQSSQPIQNQHLLIFDLPGQIQLYIHSNSLRKIIEKILKDLDAVGCMVELFDCTYIQNLQHFISLCMMSLTTMINIEMPHVNLLTKIDVLKSSQTKVNRGLINQYFNVTSMKQLVEELDYTVGESCKLKNQKSANLQYLESVANIIDTYGQVSFMPYSIYKPNLIQNLLYEFQKIFGTLNQSLLNPNFFQLVKDHDMFSHERAITQLQSQLMQEEEDELKKMDKDMNDQHK